MAWVVVFITQIQSLPCPVYTVHSRMVYTFWLYGIGVHFREMSIEKTFIPTLKYKYTWHEWNVQKTQLNITTDLCLKFKMKIPSGYGEIAWTRFGAKNEVFWPKTCISSRLEHVQPNYFKLCNSVHSCHVYLYLRVGINVFSIDISRKSTPIPYNQKVYTTRECTVYMGDDFVFM